MNIKRPPGWGSNHLCKLLDEMSKNIGACFVNERGWFNRLSDIHELYEKVCGVVNESPDWFVALFLFRSHSSYLGALRMAMSGQFPEAYMVLRGCLECALYGYFLKREGVEGEDLRLLWMKGKKDEMTQKIFKQNFRPRPIINDIKKRNKPLGIDVSALYEMMIEYGGHPNPQSIFTNLKIVKDKSTIKCHLHYFNPTGKPFILCLKTCAQVGYLCLQIFSLVFKDRFVLSGLDTTLAKVGAGL